MALFHRLLVIPDDDADLFGAGRGVDGVIHAGSPALLAYGGAAGGIWAMTIALESLDMRVLTFTRSKIKGSFTL